MKLATTLLITLALLLGWASGQSASHQVAVIIPGHIGIRILGDGGWPRAVVFDYSANPTAYLAAAQGSGILLPTAVEHFNDIQVSTNRLFWSVHVRATPLSYSGSETGAGLTLADIRVRRGVRSGLSPRVWTWSYLSTWTLSTTFQRIVQGLFPTGGWRSLGFNGWDYELRVHGDEDPGTYTTVVTYSLTAP
ncbi:MAG: hypothetical protein KGZ60_00195 [Truepera sp.]|nr:hypothetical protein [Truepera sp.]